MTVRPPLPAVDDEWEELLPTSTATEDLGSWRRSKRGWNLETVVIVICFGAAIVAEVQIAYLLW